jgi:hypothetical protein
MKAYAGVEAWTHNSWARYKMELRASFLAPSSFNTWERTRSTHWIGRWVGPRAGMKVVEERKISCLCRESHPGRQARSLSLYRLIYPIQKLYFCYEGNIRIFAVLKNVNHAEAYSYEESTSSVLLSAVCLAIIKVTFPCTLIKHHAMKASGEWRYSSIILDLGSSWRWVISLTLRPLYSRRKRPRYQEPVWTLWSK